MPPPGLFLRTKKGPVSKAGGEVSLPSRGPRSFAPLEACNALSAITRLSRVPSRRSPSLGRPLPARPTHVRQEASRGSPIVSETLFAVSVIVTLVYVTSASCRHCPGGQVMSDGGG